MMSSVNLILSHIESREEIKQFILSEAEYVIRDVDFDTDYNLTLKVSSKLGKRQLRSNSCAIYLKRPGVPCVWKVERTGQQFYPCIRSASESFKKIIRKHQEIELGSASRVPTLC